MDYLQLTLGFLIAAVIAYAANRVHALNTSGALAALVLGTVVFGLGGFAWAVVLMMFFVTSSGLSKLFKDRKQAIETQNEKGSRRDAWQVIANGGVAGLAVLFHILFPGSLLPWMAFVCAFAAANADTWATELGFLNKTLPRRINSWQKVPAGSSGAVSLAGTLAAAAGAGLIGLTAWLFWPQMLVIGQHGWKFALVILVAGLFGSLVDSLLGATLQAVYWCPACEKETEKSQLHTCGTPTTWQRGVRWIGNDLVNMACTGSGAQMGLMIKAFF